MFRLALQQFQSLTNINSEYFMQISSSLKYSECNKGATIRTSEGGQEEFKNKYFTSENIENKYFTAKFLHMCH